VTSWIQQFRILPSKQDSEAILLRSLEHWSFHHSIEPADGGEEFREQLAHDARHREWWRLSHIQDMTILTLQWEKSNMIDQIEFEHHSYKSIEHNQQLENLQSTQQFCPWMRPYEEPKGKLRDNFRVSTVMTIILLLERSAPILVGMYTYSLATWKKPTSRDILWRHKPTHTQLQRRSIIMDEDQSTNKERISP